MEYPATTATVETLPNGLTLILDPDPTAPVVSTQIWVETGSIHEDPLLGSGVSHFLEHMVFKGTRDYDADQLADTVQAAGGHWNAYTSFDRTVYYIDGPAHSLPVFLKCLTGLVFFPTLPESEFEKEKDVIRREIDMGLDDPDNAATRLLFATAFQLDPRRHPVIGHRHRFDAIRYARPHRLPSRPLHPGPLLRRDFRRFRSRTTPANSSTALTADCLQGCGREPLVAIDPPQLGPRRARETFAIPASRISLAWKSPALDHPDTPAFDVLAAILGRGRVVPPPPHPCAKNAASPSKSPPSRGPAPAAKASSPSPPMPNPPNATPSSKPSWMELAALHTDRLDDDLAKAQRQIAASQFRSLTTASGRASDLASNWHEARDLDFTRRHVAAIQGVTVEDLRRVAGRLTDERLTLTVLDPLDAPAPARAGKIRRRREDIQVHTLPNGLTLALIPDRRVPLVHLQAAVRAGLPSETPATNGLNQLLAATLPKGTATRSAREIATTLESLGASICRGHRQQRAARPSRRPGAGPRHHRRRLLRGPGFPEPAGGCHRAGKSQPTRRARRSAAGPAARRFPRPAPRRVRRRRLRSRCPRLAGQPAGARPRGPRRPPRPAFQRGQHHPRHRR